MREKAPPRPYRPPPFKPDPSLFSQLEEGAPAESGHSSGVLACIIVATSGFIVGFTGTLLLLALLLGG
ncbi:MAG: hypothetical protein V3V32_04380 [Dehalococcoidia bacterium]